jgi:hypothetical protein
MNANNVANSLTAAINASVTAGDLVAPISIPMTVRILVADLAAREDESIQAAKDLAANNAVAAAVRAGKNVGQS